MPLSLTAYRALTSLAAPFLPALLKARVNKGKENPERLQERSGYATRKRPDGPLIWMHGASIGESQALLLLHDALRAEDPSIQTLLTTQTTTSAELITRKAPEGLIHQVAPLDTPFATQRFLRHWSPDLAVFAEGEIWPNLLTGLDKRRIPRLLLNARITEKSFDGWLRVPALAKKLFGGFDTIQAANQQTADRLNQFTRQRVRMTGNIKHAAPPLAADPQLKSRFSGLAGPRTIVAAISTHPDEEEMIARATQSLSASPLLIIAPRHPERGPDIEQNLRADNAGPIYLRSRDGEPKGDEAVWICDTLGEVGLWIALSDVVFLGGGVQGAGIYGHNPIEALKLDRHVISFSEVDNFRQEFRDLVAADAASLVDTEAELVDALRSHLSEGTQPAPNRGRLAQYLKAETALHTARDAVLSALKTRTRR